jgi:hypothetical protein
VAKGRRVRQLYVSPFRVVPNKIAASHVSRSPRCRFHATFEGFEWFIYNRTAAFDNIVSHMEANASVPERHARGSSADRAASQMRHIFSKSPTGGDGAYIFFLLLRYSRVMASQLVVDVQTPRVRNYFSTPKFLRNFVQWLRGQLPDFDFKNLLPFSFEGLNGGIVCGNMSTSSILVAEFSRVDGIFGTVPVRHCPLLLSLSSPDSRNGPSPIHP